VNGWGLHVIHCIQRGSIVSKLLVSVEAVQPVLQTFIGIFKRLGAVEQGGGRRRSALCVGHVYEPKKV
jgi:hypothetical protein